MRSFEFILIYGEGNLYDNWRSISLNGDNLRVCISLFTITHRQDDAELTELFKSVSDLCPFCLTAITKAPLIGQILTDKITGVKLDCQRSFTGCYGRCKCSF